MADIARSVEGQKRPLSDTLPVIQNEAEFMTRNHLAKSATTIATSLHAKAIITSTKSGDTAKICASYRAKTPIIALSADMRTVRELSLSFGILAEQIVIPTTTSDLVRSSLNRLLEEEHIQRNDLIVFIGGGQVYSAHTNFIQVDTPATLLK
jgi:pyruvate kinase